MDMDTNSVFTNIDRFSTDNYADKDIILSVYTLISTSIITNKLKAPISYDIILLLDI